MLRSDLWPLGPQQIIITDPDIALHITAVKNQPKHPAEGMFIDPIVGRGNIVAADGPFWKHLHQMLAPAFAISHVRNMVGMIAEEVMTFRSILHSNAQSGQVFSLETTSSNLTFDIIGKATFGYSLNSQYKTSPALEYFDDICHSFIIERDGWNPFSKFVASRKRLAATKKLDALIGGMIKERFDVLQRDNITIGQKRGLSILDLVLRDHIEETRKADRQTSNLGPGFLELAITQIKTLLLGGTGTTTDTVCFIFMLLSTHPVVVQKLREEHDHIFTPSIDATYTMLHEYPGKINDLEYTSNVIKETLRLYPVGNTARAADSTGFITYDGQQWETTGHMICPVQHAMHYNPKFFPNPSSFDPDRFSRDESPRHAWRPFERGSRACLGQTLAMDELKIILLLTVRDFDFECANLEPNETQRVPWSTLDLTFGDRAFQQFIFEARPRDGMPMTVKAVARSDV